MIVDLTRLLDYRGSLLLEFSPCGTFSYRLERWGSGFRIGECRSIGCLNFCNPRCCGDGFWRLVGHKLVWDVGTGNVLYVEYRWSRLPSHLPFFDPDLEWNCSGLYIAFFRRFYIKFKRFEWNKGKSCWLGR